MVLDSKERMDQAPATGPIFPRLSSGPRKMEAEAVARHQRGRLEGAMVDAVARHGYAETTLRELVTLAGVSKATFYEHFESKQDCFLSTFDDIIDEASARVGEAFGGPGEPGREAARRAWGASRASPPKKTGPPTWPWSSR